ncbi:hypothetical protein K7432_003796 [Basidiobolus ranarum]|uniref:PWWP domain-containing protein n=1 Tax=Basidiobolus ranarum TaxID=34480 RepID=A0ABR2WZA3_9FUNG
MSLSSTSEYKPQLDLKSALSGKTSKFHPFFIAKLPNIVWIKSQGKWWPGRILDDRTRVPLKIQKFSPKKEIVRLGAPSKKNIQPFYCIQADKFIKQWKGSEKEREFRIALSRAHDAARKDEELPSVDDVLSTAGSHAIQNLTSQGESEVIKSSYLTELLTLEEEELPSVDNAIRLTSHYLNEQKCPIESNSCNQPQRVSKGKQTISQIESCVDIASPSVLADIERFRSKGKNKLELRSNLHSSISITKPQPLQTQVNYMKKKYEYIDDEDDFTFFSSSKLNFKSKSSTSFASHSLEYISNEKSTTAKGDLLQNSREVSNRRNVKVMPKNRSNTGQEPRFDDRDELALLASQSTPHEICHSMGTPNFSDSDSDSIPSGKIIIKPRVIRYNKQRDELALVGNGVEQKKIRTESSHDVCEPPIYSQLILNEDPDFDLDTRYEFAFLAGRNETNLFLYQSLMVPGELCLAYLSSCHSYFPGKVISYKRPNKYRVQIYDGQRRVLSRSDFFTIYEPEFQTCPLGDFALEREDPDYENTPLRREVVSHEIDLIRIICGGDENSWRYDKFFRSLRERRILAHYISRGPFGINEFHFISRVLKQMFTEQRTADPEEEASYGFDFISVEQLHLNSDLLNPKILQQFCDDVLLPEVIIRMIMTRENIEYREAEQEMLHGYMDSRWVEQVMAARHSFADGRISLVEKHRIFRSVDRDEDD